MKNINLEIKKGETIAVVGINGAGKSSLSKLIIGLFPPKSGSIEYDGMDINTMSLNSINHNTSGVMQNFNKYKLSLAENIIISDIYSDINEEKIISALENFDININRFDQGLNTILSTEFSGIELSRGQWQKIAIARAFYKNHNIIILDEPTAAIDPEMETCIYKNIKKISRDKTAVIITHRLGMTADVDRIVILDNGRIIEEGSYLELMSFDSQYKKMYLSQSKWYDFEDYNKTV